MSNWNVHRTCLESMARFITSRELGSSGDGPRNTYVNGRSTTLLLFESRPGALLGPRSNFQIERGRFPFLQMQCPRLFPQLAGKDNFHEAVAFQVGTIDLGGVPEVDHEAERVICAWTKAFDGESAVAVAYRHAQILVRDEIVSVRPKEHCSGARSILHDAVNVCAIRAVDHPQGP